MPDITVQDAIRQEAKKAGIPEAFALAVAEQESGFNPGATSPKGALGVMQLMPETAKKYKVDPNNPIENIRGGVQHLRYLLDKYQGDPEKSLAAYNAGEGIVGKDLPAETKAYVPGVLDRMKKFTQSAQSPDKMSATIDPKTRGQVPNKPTKPPTSKPLDLTKLPQHMVETSIAGAKRAAGGAIQTLTGAGEGGRERGVRDLFEGALEASTPLSVPLAMISVAVNPLETLSALAVSTAGGAVTERAAKHFGASPDTAALAGDFAGLLSPEVAGLGLGAARRAVGASPEARAAAADLVRINTEHGLNLSGPEMMPQGLAGTAARQGQRAMTMSLSGGATQSVFRTNGEKNGVAAVDAAIRSLANPTTKEGAGRAAQEGLLAAKAGKDAIGKRVGEAVEKAPVVDLASPTKSGRLGIQTEIERIVGDEVLPDLIDHPAGARTHAAQKALENFKKNGSPIWVPDQVGGRTLSPEAKRIFKLLPTTTKDAPFAPFTEQLKGLYFGQNFRRFTSVLKSREQIAGGSKVGTDPYFAPDKQAGLARYMTGLLTEHLHETSPEYSKAATEYRQALDVIGSKKALMTGMLKDIATKPSDAVDYISAGPEYARNFREALHGVAAQGPQAGVAKAAYEVTRATWWQNKVLYDATGKPDLAGMADRIQKNAPVIQELYGDAKGKQLVQTGTDIAKAVQAHVPSFQRNMYLLMVGAGVLSGRSPSTFLNAEAASGALTWMMYNPKYANYFIHGTTGGPKALVAAEPVMRRIGQAYGAHLGVVKAQAMDAAKKKAENQDTPQ